MDRASGSGVFARDPDALLDLTELELTDDIRKAEDNRLICDICQKWITRFDPEFKNKVSQDDLLSAVQMREHAHKLLPPQTFDLMMGEINERKAIIEKRTAWRIEGTLREFASFPPISCWFQYPIHRHDESGALADLKLEDNKKPWERATDKRKKNSSDNINSFINAYNSLCIDGELPTMQEIATLLGKPLNTVRDWAKKAGYKVNKDTGKVCLSGETKNEN